MPIYNFTSPEGKTYKIEGPEGSTKAQAFQILQKRLSGAGTPAPAAPTGPPKADFSGVTSGASSTAPIAQPPPTFRNPATGAVETQEERMARLTKQAALEPKIDPTGTTFENIAAGAGKNIMGAVRGGRQLFNMITGDDEELAQLQAEEEEARRLDEPLMDTKAGKAGYYGTELASWLLPAAKVTKIPGIARLGKAGVVAGEAALGGLQGAMQATTKDESKLKNAALGATLGAALPASGAILRRAGDIGEALPFISPMVGRRRARVAGEERVAAAARSKLETEARRVEAHNAKVDTRIADAARQEAKAQFENRRKDLLRRVGKGIGEAVEGQRIAVPKAKVDALRSVQRRYGDDMPPEFTKLIDDMDLAAKHGFGKGEMLQQAKAALGDRARGNAKRGLPTTGLHEAERVISDIILNGLPKARAEALRKKYGRYEKVARATTALPARHIPAKKAAPIAKDLSKPLAARGLRNPLVRSALRSYILPEGEAE